MRTTVSTSDAPMAIGPYSQAVKHGGLLWCSGQLGLRPGNGDLVGDDTAKQTQQALSNLDAVCREAGTSLAKALRLTVYLVDMGDFPAMNAVYAGFFEVPYPARVTIQAAALPKGGRVEIDAVVAL
jgi:2-iminobutanoate/2-iminopropanoate deaminase